MNERFDYNYNHNLLAYIVTDNGKKIADFDAETGTDEDVKIIVDLLNKQEKEIQRQQLVIYEVADAIMEDIRKQVNKEFLEFMGNYDSLDEMKAEIEEYLKEDGDVE